MTDFKTFDDLIHLIGGDKPQMESNPITPRMIRAVTLDILSAARLLDAQMPIQGKYRAAQAIGNTTDVRLADRGAPDYLAMACGAGLVRKVAGCLNGYDDDDEATEVLDQCRHGVMEGLEVGTSTIYQANLARTVLTLADPLVSDEQRFVRAREWSEKRGAFDTLQVIYCAAELINALAWFCDNPDVVLDGIVVGILEADLGETTEGE